MSGQLALPCPFYLAFVTPGVVRVFRVGGTVTRRARITNFWNVIGLLVDKIICIDTSLHQAEIFTCLFRRQLHMQTLGERLELFWSGSRDSHKFSFLIPPNRNDADGYAGKIVSTETSRG